MNALKGLGKFHGDNPPHIKKTALPQAFYPFRHFHMLNVHPEPDQTPALKFHHPQNIPYNDSHKRRQRNLSHCRFHHIGHGITFPLGNGNLRYPATSGKNVTNTSLFQLTGYFKAFQRHPICESLGPKPLYSRYPGFFKTVAVKERTVPQLFHRRG